jgi:hypothetical protein
MNTRARIVLTVLMWLVALSHFAIGVALLGPQAPREWIAAAYCAEVAWDHQFTYILKPLGVFMIALGAVGVMAARRPLAHKPIVIIFILLLAARVVQRLIHTTDITEAFAISASRTYFNAAAFAMLSIALLLSLIIASRGGLNHAHDDAQAS